MADIQYNCLDLLDRIEFEDDSFKITDRVIQLANDT